MLIHRTQICVIMQRGKHFSSRAREDAHLVLGTWVVGLLAFGAEDLHCALSWHITGAHWQAGLPIAQHARAAAELTCLVLLIHGTHATAGQDVADMNEAIQCLCRALHELMLLICQDLCAGGVSIQDQVQRIVIVGHLHSQQKGQACE
jgi:hypothetical protein